MQTIFLFQDRLRICLPENFSLIQSEKAAEIYPSLKRPQVIYADAGFSRFLTFSLLDKLLGSEETLNAAKEMRKLIWSLYPSSILSDVVSIRFGNLRCSGFSFRTGPQEEQVFNTMCAVSLENRLLLNTFGCGIDDEDGKTLLRQKIAETEYIKIELRDEVRYNGR